jgi:acetolactate decarboxylase
VPRQQRPYRELNEVVKSQSVFQFQARRGTIAGFRCPAYAKGINVPGYHLHFLASDFKAGGHVLDFRSHGATVEIEEISSLALALPGDSCFLKADLSPDRENEIKKVEK